MAANPAQPKAAAITAGSWRSSGALRAIRPPRPSSQARVGSEKNATGSLAWVSHKDNSSEPTLAAPSVKKVVDRDGRRHHQTREVMTTRSGQTR